MVMSYFFCAFILTGPAAVSAVSVDSQARFIRRQGVDTFNINADGQMVHMEDETASEVAPEEQDLCRLDYPKGHEGTNDCSTGHDHILTERVCRHAANQSGAFAYEDDFIINWTYYLKRPLGCFAKQCPTGSKMCYYYNGSPADQPDTQLTDFAGTPVCRRPRFANGTSVPNDVSNGCPTGYTAIMHEGACKSAAKCQGIPVAGTDPESGNFLVGTQNASQHRDHPIGCFILDGQVYFNFVETGFGVPDTPVGTPICHVAATTSW